MLNSLEFMSPTAGCFVTGDPAFGIQSQLTRTAHAYRAATSSAYLSST
jgi:hypothetical protein